MDLSKLSPNNMMAGGGGLLALISTILPWYGVDDAGVSVSSNAWGSGFLGWFGALLVFAGGLLIVLDRLDIFNAKVAGLAVQQLAMVVAGLGFVLILLKLLTDNSLTKYGIFAGLIGGAIATAGAFLSGKDAGVGLPTADNFKGPGTTGGARRV